MTLRYIELYDDIDFDFHYEQWKAEHIKREKEYNEWKSKQPEWIAVEIETFKEAVEHCSEIETRNNFFKITMFFGNELYRYKDCRLYKKIPNPYLKGAEVIPW